MLNLARTARTRPLGVLHPAFSLQRLLRDALLEKLPADAHLRASGRLCVSLTRLADGRNVLVSQFESREELVQVENISRSRQQKVQQNPSVVPSRFCCAAVSSPSTVASSLLPTAER